MRKKRPFKGRRPRLECGWHGQQGRHDCTWMHTSHRGLQTSSLHDFPAFTIVTLYYLHPSPVTGRGTPPTLPPCCGPSTGRLPCRACRPCCAPAPSSATAAAATAAVLPRRDTVGDRPLPATPSPPPWYSSLPVTSSGEPPPLPPRLLPLPHVRSMELPRRAPRPLICDIVAHGAGAAQRIT